MSTGLNSNPKKELNKETDDGMDKGMDKGMDISIDKNFDKNIDYTKIIPYGDTLNDGRIQLSFTLPIKCDDRAIEAAKILAGKMGIVDVNVAHHHELDAEFTFFVVYGTLKHSVDVTSIKLNSIQVETMEMSEVDKYIEENIKRKVVVIGASTGTDAHTVGIDAIMNMKGYAGHYGLERYQMIEAYNLGSQVTNEEFILKAKELKADVLLVSQTVTQKDVHIKNMTELVELLEAMNLRDKIILIAGGPRVTNELAKELGYDAGFATGKYADDVASFFVKEIAKREML